MKMASLFIGWNDANYGDPSRSNWHGIAARS